MGNTIPLFGRWPVYLSVRSGAGDRRRQFRSVEERPRGTCWSVVCVQLLVCFRLQSHCIGSHLILIAGRRPLASFGATTRAVVFFLARPVSFFWLVEIDRIEWCLFPMPMRDAKRGERPKRSHRSARSIRGLHHERARGVHSEREPSFSICAVYTVVYF